MVGLPAASGRAPQGRRTAQFGAAGLILGLGLLAAASVRAVPTVRTDLLARLPWGAPGPRRVVGVDGRAYGPSDFVVVRGGGAPGHGEAVVFADPFAGRLWRVDLPGARLAAAGSVPRGVAALAPLDGAFAWVDPRTWSVGVGPRLLGRLPRPPGGLLAVLDFQAAAHGAFLLVRVEDTSGTTDALYLVTGVGLRRLGTGVEGMAVVPGTEEFYFVRRGHLYAPSGREILRSVPGRLVGADRQGALAFAVERRDRTEVAFWPQRRTLTLPAGPVVVGTRLRLLPDGTLVWIEADRRHLDLFRTRFGRAFVVRRPL